MTLMEIMVSMAVLSMIGAMSWTALGQTFMARDALERQDEVHQQARVALERMSRELSLAHISGNTTVPNSYRTVFVGKDEEPADSLWFASISHHRIYRDSREADQTELTYWVEQDPNDRDSYVLLHREAPRIDHEPDKDGTILPLAYGVKRLDFKYLDGIDYEWEDEWDTTGVEHPNKLPRAVRIILVLEGPSASDPEDTEEFTYATTVMLEFSGAVKRSALASGQAASPGGNPLSGGRTRAVGAGGIGAGGVPGGNR